VTDSLGLLVFLAVFAAGVAALALVAVRGSR